MPAIGLRSSAARPAAWWPSGAAMALDFVNDRYMKDGVPVARSAVMNFARATPKLAEDSTGFWRSFAADVPATTDRGLLLEPADTNCAPNAGRPELMSSSAPYRCLGGSCERPQDHSADITPT